MLVQRQASGNRPAERGFEYRNLYFDGRVFILEYTNEMVVVATA